VRTKSWLTPVPPTVAIEIASRRVSIVEVSWSEGDRPAVTRQVSESFRAGAVAPALTGLNIVDPGEVSSAIERALARAEMGVPSRVALVVPDSIARVSLITLEEVPSRAADLEQVIRWQLKKATPFSLDDAQVSHFIVSSDGAATTMAAVVARRDVVSEYEATVGHLGIQPGVVDLASLNVMNVVIGSGTIPSGDWLLVHRADESTTLAILRGRSLMLYRHRMRVDDESLGLLVHQTAMYHEDRLGGSGFARVWVSGGGHDIESVRLQTSERLGMPVESVDIRDTALVASGADIPVDTLDSLAAPVGALIRDHVT